MLGLSPAQVRGYASKGFITPERGSRGELMFGFDDLLVLRTAGELVAQHVPSRRVRKVIERLRERIPSERALATLRLEADGDRVIVRDGGSAWNAESGQVLLDFSTEPAGEEHATAGEWYELGCELEESDAEEAAGAYERALSIDPMLADAHVNLGRLLHEQRAPLRAAEHYQRALAIDPGHETAAFNLGVALEDLGRLDEAVEAYERALEIDDTLSDAHFNLAGILERRGDKPAALRHLKACRSLR